MIDFTPLSATRGGALISLGLATGAAETMVFVAFMAGGMVLTKQVESRWGDLRRSAPSRT